MVKNGAIQVHSTTRIRNQNSRKEGATEWFYCTQDIIHLAFDWAKTKYGGKLEKYTFKKNMNKKALESEKVKPNYIGRVIYNVAENCYI